MVYHEDAVYLGGTEHKFVKNQNYPIAIKTHWWNRKVQVYQRRGYYDEMQPGTLHEFKNKDEFNKSWNVKEY